MQRAAKWIAQKKETSEDLEGWIEKGNRLHDLAIFDFFIHLSHFMRKSRTPIDGECQGQESDDRRSVRLAMKRYRRQALA